MPTYWKFMPEKAGKQIARISNDIAVLARMRESYHFLEYEKLLIFFSLSSHIFALFRSYLEIA